MELKETIKEYPVTDYDFAFIGGSRLPLTLNLEKGDTVLDLETVFVFNLVEKPNVLDPEKPIPGETITVFKSHVTAYIQRDRLQRDPTKEELFNMRNLLHPEVKTVQ